MVGFYWLVGVLLYLLVAQELLWVRCKVSDTDELRGPTTFDILYCLFWFVPLVLNIIVFILSILVACVWEALAFGFQWMWECLVRALLWLGRGFIGLFRGKG